MATRVVIKQINKDPKIHNKQVHWSDKQKLEAVSMYLMVGNMALVSDATKIPYETIKFWRNQEWWKDYEREVRHSANIETSGKLKGIISKAANVVSDRLENGDIVFDSKTGEIKRRPVNAKTANDILAKSIDKDVLIQRIEEQPDMKEEAIMDRLIAIQAQLRKNIKQQKPEMPVIEAEVIDEQRS